VAAAERSAAAARLRAGTWRCRSCGEAHGWPFDLAAMAPDHWPHRDGYEDNAGVILALDAAGQGEAVDFLSEDFCLLGGRHFLIRCVLLVPVAGLAQPFGFGCWATLSQENFRRYLDGFDSGRHAHRGPWTGWLCNMLGGLTGDQPIGVEVRPRGKRQRPLLEVLDPGEPLARAQRDGLEIERLVELLDSYGHA
jgi:hypothetical protein